MPRFSRLCSMATGICRTKSAADASTRTANAATRARGREKARRSQAGAWRSGGGGRGSGLTGWMRSNTRRNAGTSVKVNTQQSSMPTPPMKPKCRNPRLAAAMSMANETLDAAAARSVACAATGAAWRQAGSSPIPLRRSCRTRVR